MITDNQQTVLPEVECIRHPQGYCAIASGKPFDPSYFPWETLCGQYVLLPLGGDRRRPTCEACAQKMKERTLSEGE